MAIAVLEGGDGSPREPDWASIYSDPLDVAVAADVWQRTTREMRERETLAVVNGLAIKRYVMACVLHEVAARHVVEEGPVVRGAKGVSYGPWWSVMKDADARAMAHESELGLSPRRRATAGKVQRGSKKGSASDKYLRAVR